MLAMGGVGLVALGGAAYVAPPMMLRVVQTRRLARLCAQTRSLVLTYDDGPGRELTPRLLDLLAQRGAKATFFLLGRRAQREPTIADRLKGEGHEIGTHSQEHLHAWKTPPGRWARDLAQGIETVARWNPRPIFRPPYGKITTPGLIAARSWAPKLGWWTVDARDTWSPPRTPDEVAELAKQGGVVLLHDFDREGRAELVLDCTRRLLDLADEQGLTVRRLGDVLGGVSDG